MRGCNRECSDARELVNADYEVATASFLDEVMVDGVSCFSEFRVSVIEIHDDRVAIDVLVIGKADGFRYYGYELGTGNVVDRFRVRADLGILEVLVRSCRVHV